MTIAVLAGGRSRRMGRDKAAVTIAGRALLEHVLQAAAGTGLPIVQLGGAAPPGTTHRVIPDEQPGEGPLAGLVTGLAAVEDDLLLVGCDLPCLTAEAFAWLLDRERGEHGCVTRSAGNLEPLFAIYRRAVEPPARERLARGERSLQRLLHDGEFTVHDLPARLAGVLLNVNTPAELDVARRRLEPKEREAR